MGKELSKNPWGFIALSLNRALCIVTSNEGFIFDNFLNRYFFKAVIK